MAGPGPLPRERTGGPSKGSGDTVGAGHSAPPPRGDLRGKSFAEQRATVDPNRQGGFAEQAKALEPGTNFGSPPLPDHSRVEVERCDEAPARVDECGPDARHMDVGTLRTEAAKALMTLAISSGECFDRLVARQKSAWGVVFQTTGRSPYIALSEPQYTGMVHTSTPLTAGSPFGAALGTVAGAVGNTAFEGAAGHVGAVAVKAAIGRASTLHGVVRLRSILRAFSGAGVPGFVFSTVTNLVWDLISGMCGKAPDLGEIVDSEIERSHAARTAVEQAIEKACAPKRQETSQSITAAHDFVLRCDDREALRSVLEWAVQNEAAAAAPLPATDEALAVALLKEWVMQHAATPEKANEDTTQKTWAKHRDDKEVTLRGRRDLFIHQCSYAWGRMGVDVGRMAQRLRRELAKHQADEPGDIADALDGLVVDLGPIADAAAFARHLEQEQPADGALGASGPIAEHPERAAMSRTFDLRCTLGLKEADDAVCVDELEFDLTPHAGYDARRLEARSYDPDAPEMSAIASRRWDYKPR